MRSALSVCLSVALAFNGCASYVADPAPAPRPDAMPAWRVDDSVAVGGDPYVRPERLETVFGRDLAKVHVIPIQVLIQNRSEHKLWLQTLAMALELPDGTQISPVPATEVATLPLPDDSGMAGKAALTIGAVLYEIGILVACGFTLRACFLPHGALGGVAKRSTTPVDQRRVADYWSKELKDATLGKDESANGFVFFLISQGTKALSEATVVLDIVNLDETRRFVVRLPLSGLGH